MKSKHFHPISLYTKNKTHQHLQNLLVKNKNTYKKLRKKISIYNYSFFQLLTSFCPICSHIFKTLNTISTTSVCCNHTISTICVVFTQYAVNYHVSKMLTFSFHTSLPKTKIMDLFSHIYKCLNTACHN